MTTVWVGGWVVWADGVVFLALAGHRGKFSPVQRKTRTERSFFTWNNVRIMCVCVVNVASPTVCISVWNRFVVFVCFGLFCLLLAGRFVVGAKLTTPRPPQQGVGQHVQVSFRLKTYKRIKICVKRTHTWMKNVWKKCKRFTTRFGDSLRATNVCHKRVTNWRMVWYVIFYIIFLWSCLLKIS